MSALLCVYCCGGAAEPVEAWVLVLLATDGLPCSAPGDFGGSSCQGASMGPACLTGWLAYTTLPTLTFYYDGWKAPPKLDSLKGKRGNEKQKMHGQCETWSFGQIYAECKTMFCSGLEVVGDIGRISNLVNTARVNFGL